MEIYRGDVVRAAASYDEQHIEKKEMPYLIVSNNAINKYVNVLVGIPFTTAQKKKLLPCHYRFFFNGRINTALCEQPTLISRENIKGLIEVIDDKHLKKIETILKKQLGV